MANEKTCIPLLDLNGPILKVHSKVLSSLPDGFNKEFYLIKVVAIDSTRNDCHPLGKINTCL